MADLFDAKEEMVDEINDIHRNLDKSERFFVKLKDQCILRGLS